MYKLYEGCLNTFLQEHCIRNNTITPEQAGGKPEVGGSIKQLLLNISILNEVIQSKRNLITIWLDYQRVFDSIPHDWMIQYIRLAKIPEKLVTAIETLTKQWATIVQLQGDKSSITSGVINFSNGVFQSVAFQFHFLCYLSTHYHTCMVSLRAIITEMTDKKQ